MNENTHNVNATWILQENLHAHYVRTHFNSCMWNTFYCFAVLSIIIGFTCASNMHVLQLTPESRLLYVRVWALDLNEKARKFNKQHELAPMVYLLGTVSIHQTKLGIFETMHLTWIISFTQYLRPSYLWSHHAVCTS